MRIFRIMLLTFTLGSCSYGWVKKPKNVASLKEDNLFIQEIISKSKTGYWLVVRGYKITDHLVATATFSDYSHVAILDLENKKVIEADSKGVHETSLEKFVNKSYLITVVKPAGYTETRGNQAVIRSEEKVGKSYDFLGTIGINEPEKYYCSELAIYSYPHINDSIKMPLIIKPSEMLKFGKIVYETPERKIK